MTKKHETYIPSWLARRAHAGGEPYMHIEVKLLVLGALAELEHSVRADYVFQRLCCRSEDLINLPIRIVSGHREC